MRPEHIDVLIAGAGLAGSRTAETLRALGFEGRLLVAGDERHLPYERPALSKSFLAGKVARTDLALRESGFWRDRDIDLLTGGAVESLDLRRRTAVVAGRPMTWRRLVMATGVRGRRLPALDPYDNAFQLRTLDDADRLARELRPGVRLAVVGAGFVGLEVASTAREAGAEVTIVDVAPVPCASTLGPDVGGRLATIAAERGVDLRLGRSVADVIARGGRITALRLDDGAFVECDAVLVAIGALPNSELVAGDLAVAAGGGIAVDALGRTTVQGVYACGDVATSIEHGRIEHWTAAAATARAVAHAIAGVPPPAHAPAYFWTDQFGHRLQVVGTVRPDLSVSLEPCDRGFVARYGDDSDRLWAVALLDRPDLVADARAEVAAADAGHGRRAVA